MLSDILFCYGRENPDIAYRQGMSDILGRLLQVLLSDQQAYSLLKEEGKLEAEGFSTDAIELLDNVFDQNFLEHDS
jgi:hypothetical protein